jgi:autotransporter passenger strand-loop-strand repeat protein
VFGSAGPTFVSSGGTQNVSSGGIASSATIYSSGTQNIFSSGIAIGTSISSGGVENVFAGGVASSATFFSGAIQNVSSGGITIGGTLFGGVQNVYLGGSASGANFSSGTQNIFGGATATSAYLANGAVQNVSSGAVAIGTQIATSGVQNLYAGGAVSGTIFYAGTQNVLSGASLSGEAMFDGIQNVLSGGVVISEIASGDYYGTDYLNVFTGGVSSDTVVSYGGHEVVSGGVASNTTVNYYGFLAVMSGGTAISATLQGGGSETVYGLDLNATISTGVQTVSSGGTASGTTIDSGGSQYISSGGYAVGDVVSSGGAQIVYSGGTANGTFVSSGGTQNVSSGGTVSASTVGNGGVETVSSGGTATGVVVLSGGKQLVYGSATSTGIGSGGEQDVYSGGSAGGTLLSGGGLQDILAGGSVASTTIAGGTLELAAGSFEGGGIVFGGTGGTRKIDASSTPSTTISGFAAGDKIDLTSIGFDSAGTANLLATNVLQISEGGHTYDLDLNPFDQFAGEYFQLAKDSGTGTLITESAVACYCRGTLILTDRGEVAVEDLAIGDPVVTRSGAARPIKWIGKRSYSGRFALGQKHILPICIKAGALDDGLPRRDLWISPHHAMYLDGVLIESQELVNSVSIVQAEHVEKVEYFHIELDSHDVIVAEGALSESFVDDHSRGMFHNAHEYAGLYPQEVADTASYCAPRLDDGYLVHAVRARIEARAGLRPRVQRGPSELRGYVDVIAPTRIAGWAQAIDHPEARVCLDVLDGGRPVGQIIANRYREDLERAGLGSGRHSFEFIPPKGLVLAASSVEVRRSVDGVVLPLLQAGLSCNARSSAMRINR